MEEETPQKELTTGQEEGRRLPDEDQGKTDPEGVVLNKLRLTEEIFLVGNLKLKSYCLKVVKGNP